MPACLPSRPSSRPAPLFPQINGHHSGQASRLLPMIQSQSIVGRLDLERYKATIKGLTTFGDRRQGTDRNRAAVDWIEAQLRSYGCATERHGYVYTPPPKPAAPPPPSKDPTTRIAGGSRPRGVRAPTGAVSDPNAQPDVTLRALNAQPTTPGPREQVFCYQGGHHPSGRDVYRWRAYGRPVGFGEAANDNGSGTALVMELARILSSSDVQTDRSIRFVLWNNEETGLNGARAYVRDRAGLQGLEEPVGFRPIS